MTEGQAAIFGRFFEGMIVPSAAGDFNNLVIFVDRLSAASKIRLEEVKPLVLS